MIVKISFDIKNISIKEADDLVINIEEYVDKWAIDMCNKRRVVRLNLVSSYMIEKSIKNERYKNEN